MPNTKGGRKAPSGSHSGYAGEGGVSRDFGQEQASNVVSRRPGDRSVKPMEDHTQSPGGGGGRYPQ